MCVMYINANLIEANKQFLGQPSPSSHTHNRTHTQTQCPFNNLTNVPWQQHKSFIFHLFFCSQSKFDSTKLFVGVRFPFCLMWWCFLFNPACIRIKAIIAMLVASPYKVNFKRFSNHVNRTPAPPASAACVRRRGRRLVAARMPGVAVPETLPQAGHQSHLSFHVPPFSRVPLSHTHTHLPLCPPFYIKRKKKKLPKMIRFCERLFVLKQNLWKLHRCPLSAGKLDTKI